MESETRRFLETLFADKPSDLYILIWTLLNTCSHWFQSVDEAISFVESLGDVDVYLGVGLAQTDRGPKQRCPSEEIACLSGFFVDIDFRSNAHPSSTLPATIEEALSILPPEFPPSVVVLTGNGIHAWWFFREPWILETEDERKQAMVLSKRWNNLIQDNGRMKGFKIDRLGDLARILRIPGTMNHKDPANPKPVSIHSYTDLRFNPSDLGEYLDDHGVGDDEPGFAHQDWAKRFENKPLNLDLEAEVPQARLNGWLESDSQFKKTWFCERSDLKDQSQSGYDLALANFGYRVGLPEQEIVDLMVQHRRIHKGRPRTKLEYFYRTLSRASERTANNFAAPPECVSADEAERHNQESAASAEPSVQSPRTDRQKIQLCKALSGPLGIDILRIVKLCGKDPLYRIELASGKVDLPSIGKFLNQKSVREAIAATTGKLIPTFKKKHWDELSQTMLDACIEEDGGEELEAGGSARICISQYLAENEFITSIEGESPQRLRKPMVRNGCITICASDLRFVMNKLTSDNLTMSAVVSMIASTGATVRRVRDGKAKEQSRWELPPSIFDPLEYAKPAGGSNYGAAG